MCKTRQQESMNENKDEKMNARIGIMNQMNIL